MHFKTVGTLRMEGKSAVSPSQWFTQPLTSPAWSLPLSTILSSAPKRARKYQPNQHTNTQSDGKATAGDTHLAPLQRPGVFGLLGRLYGEGVGKGEESSGIPPAEILKTSQELETPP